jgi:hypothetical protein
LQAFWVWLIFLAGYFQYSKLLDFSTSPTAARAPSAFLVDVTGSLEVEIQYGGIQNI